MSDLFRQWLKLIEEVEGGYVNDPADLGGRTNMGVTQGFLESIAYPKDVEDLTRDDCEWIYQAHFWERVHGDGLPAPLAIITADMAVNSGVKRALITLQQALNYFGAALAVDGIIGPRTIAAAYQEYEENGAKVAKELLNRRLAYYNGLVTARPVNGKFLKGWKNRLAKVAEAAGIDWR